MNHIIHTLMQSAQQQKQVEIVYRYIGDNEYAPRRFGKIQPIDWVYSKTNTLQVLAWDTEADHWRRFEVANIEDIEITHDDWVKKDLVERVTTMPYI